MPRPKKYEALKPHSRKPGSSLIYFMAQFICLCFFSMGGLAPARAVENQREIVRQIFRKRLCGVCHIPPNSRRALEVFNLDEPDWTRKLSGRQLLQFNKRVRLTDKELKAQHGDPKLHQFTVEEIQTVQEFVDSEILNVSGGKFWK